MDAQDSKAILTLDDFLSSPWRQAIDALDTNDYFNADQVLLSAAAKSESEQKPREARVLRLLGHATSMRLDPTSLNEPFSPRIVLAHGRSAAPDDFSVDDIEFFATILAHVNAPWLCARLADLAWLTRRPRDVEHAIVAINAYRLVPLSPSSFSHWSLECWKRAIVLALMLGKRGRPIAQEIEDDLLGRFDDAPPDADFFRLSVADLLLDRQLARARAKHLAERLAGQGRRLAANREFERARRSLFGAVDWFTLSRTPELVADVMCEIAEAWAQEANTRRSGTNPSHRVAATFFEKAIQTLRQVPRALRATRRIDEKIQELHANLTSSSLVSVAEMGVVSSGPCDLSDIVAHAQDAVRGKSPAEALLSLASIHRGARAALLRQQAREALQRFPLQSLIPSVVVSPEGRVVARRPGSSVTEDDSDSVALWSQMLQIYRLEMQLVVQGQILPALRTFLLEHRIRDSDLQFVVRSSPIVPPSRVPLVAKALYFGFEGDFAAAIHLLTPQIENLVRWHLKSIGVKTTTLDADGLENEIGLSSLLEIPEVTQVFGEDLAFEFKALFADSFGPNLRNAVAHGLLEPPACDSVESAYAWWFLLFLVVNSFWNSRRAADQDDPTPAERRPSET